MDFSAVNEVSCSQSCKDTLKFYKDQVETLIREIEDVKYEKYQLWKGQKPLKAKMEAAVSDYKRIAEEHSVKSTLLTLAYEDNAKLTAELDALKAKYNDADFNFKKFDVSSKVVETMIETQLRFKNENKTKAGLGYSAVPPPFNDNYTPPLETSEFEPFEYVGKPLTTDSVVIDKSNESDSNTAETSNAEKKVVKEVEQEKKKKEEKKKEKKEKKKQDDVGFSSTDHSKTTDLISDEPKTPENHNIKLTVFVEPVVKCCSCVCQNAEKSTPTSTKSTLSEPGPIHDSPVSKRKNCFHCGNAGHLAKKCPNRSYVPINAQNWQHVPRGQSSKRSHSTSRSDGDWIADKAKRQRPVDTRERTPDSKDAFTKPFWFRSTSPNGSCSSSHLRRKFKTKGVQNSKSSVEATSRPIKKYAKPEYRWVLKRQTSTATVKGECRIFD